MPPGFHHAAAQFQGFAEQNTSNLKIRSPWRLKTNRPVKFLWSSPLWNNKEIIPELLQKECNPKEIFNSVNF